MTFCDDAMMGYDAARRSFGPGATLDFDEAYRLAHLPLVAPGHPDALAGKDGTDYRNGRYATPRHSLVVPVDAGELGRSKAFRRFEAELRSFSFSDKIAWQIGRERASKLHATIVGGLAETDLARCADAAAAALARLGALSLRIGGPFLGRINTGRIYLPVYPCCRDGEDVFALVQRACGARQTRFYVVGCYHFAAALSVAETADLSGLAERWRRRILAELPVTSLAVMATNDDLALSGRVVAAIPAGGG
ncbi:hypothetical protein ASC75_14605 [Aminobacter sp. DSM 101952]|uniref:hypothetical protein n=1 Tax=Aminobacter sp. DSM 101952 TaxID=2735891 RepID=UPI0006FC399F|nr:hypothetical protein [Aminobacter sp. DSM 101952]KQU64359.1 hypothetical protein ASC75_14605 [Aminobacter sp. DSM 101952]